jgi:hypothetical protein
MLKFWIMMTYGSLFFIISVTTQAQPMDGSCALHNFSKVMVDRDGTLDTNQGVWVLRDNAPVYSTVDSSDSISTQEFGAYLIPVKVAKRHDGVQRVQVNKMGTDTSIGWMEGYDLLCGVNPLQSKKGLDRKVFVKTPASHDPRLSTIPAYLSYEGPCNGDCQQFSRFELFFIFADDKLHRRYLILKTYTLQNKDKPFSVTTAGWIKYDHIIPWDTTLGLRPKETVEKVLAYEQPEDIWGGNSSIEVAGGNNWYTHSIHIPILDLNQEQKYYHTAASGIGFKLYENVLSSLKSVDVFFLIDGTASMGPYIEAARQAVQEVAINIRKHPDFNETSFRFGFRIYRDNYADKILSACQRGVCEGMPLSSQTCEANPDQTKSNWQTFIQQLGKVKETSNDQDDYPEKLFDGLHQTILDMIPCGKRTKLLFVIGDHGDRQVKNPQYIVDLLKNYFKKQLIFFIQTPNKSNETRTPSSYNAAYTAYRNQALQILQGTLSKDVQHEDYFLSLSQSSLTTTIVDQVKRYSSSGVVNELEQAIKGGKSLSEIIEQFKKEGDMPVIYKKWLKDTACPKLGEQCETSVEHGVRDFYIPIDDNKIQEEVWMTVASLDNWLKLLRPFKRIKNLPVGRQKKVFIRLLKKQIQDIIGGYPPSRIALSEWLAAQRQQVLPMRQDSPLLQYSFDEIRRLKGCEVSLLVNWVVEIRKVLQRVYSDSTKKVAFTPQYPTSISCPLSDKGKKVPVSLEYQPSKPLGMNSTYRYDHSLYGKKVYWLPVEFLP